MYWATIKEKDCKQVSRLRMWKASFISSWMKAMRWMQNEIKQNDVILRMLWEWKCFSVFNLWNDIEVSAKVKFSSNQSTYESRHEC